MYFCRHYLIITNAGLLLTAFQSRSFIPLKMPPGTDALHQFGRRKFITIAALSMVLQEVKELGLPEHVSRSSIKRAREREFEQESSTPYGEVLRQISVGKDCTTGSTMLFWMLDPRATLYYLIQSSPKLEAFIRGRLVTHPSTMHNPWTIILYTDEIVSGDPLKPRNHRKTHAYYWSFVEFGKESLSSEFLWFTEIVVKSDSVNQIDGLGAGQLCKHMMLAFDEMQTEGFQCGSIIIWAKVRKFISDEAAQKASFDVSGASGSLPCLKCRNVVGKKSFDKMRDKTGFVSIAELDVNSFNRHDDNTIIANASWLAANRHLTKREFAKLQTSLGLRYAPNGVLLCTSFNVTSSICFDWQHVYFVHGIFNNEVGALLDMLHYKTINGTKVTHKVFHEFCSAFKMPFHHKAGTSVFEKRSRDGGALVCSASEALGVFKIIEMFLCLRVFDNSDSKVQAACVSFYALCRVCEALTMTARGNVSPSGLLELIVTHLRRFKAAYGSSSFVPKCHSALHLPEQLEKWDMLIACFTHERKHKEVKRYIQNRSNAESGFERHVMQDVLHIQKLVLEEDLTYPSGACLLRERRATPKIAKTVQEHCQTQHDVFTAVGAKASSFTTVHVNDFVYINYDEGLMVGQIIFLCRVKDLCLACVRLYIRTPQLHIFHTNGDSYLVRLSDIVDTCIYRTDGDVAFVIPPRGIARA